MDVKGLEAEKKQSAVAIFLKLFPEEWRLLQPKNNAHSLGNEMIID